MEYKKPGIPADSRIGTLPSYKSIPRPLIQVVAVKSVHARKDVNPPRKICECGDPTCPIGPFTRQI